MSADLRKTHVMRTICAMRTILTAAALLAACDGAGPATDAGQSDAAAAVPDAGPEPALECVGGEAGCPEGWAAGCAESDDAHVGPNESNRCVEFFFTSTSLDCDPATGELTEGCPAGGGEPRCVPLLDDCPDPGD